MLERRLNFKMKNATKNITICFFLLSIFGSCSEVNYDPSLSIHSAPVESFTVVSDSIPTVSFLVKAWWNNTCGEYHSADIFTDGSTYKIKVNGWVSRTDVACGDGFTPFEGRVNILIFEEGNYNFEFWVNDSTNLDTTFYVLGRSLK